MCQDSPLIMIIDDEPQNLHVLERMLRQNGYNVLAFPRGDLALNALETVQPDLILLDVRMPVMDGYTVCNRLKQLEHAKPIPVIFLSGLSETSDKVRAFEAGGVDYVTKPLSEPEVLARVRTQLSLYRQTQYLNEQIKLHTAELARAHHRLQVWDTAKTHWITMLAHELRTPLTGLFCVADILFTSAPPDTGTTGLREDFDASCARIRKLIDDATMLATAEIADESLTTKRVDLGEIARAVVNELSVKDKEVLFTLRTPLPDDLMISAAPGLLTRALYDLGSTAACCVQPDGHVCLSVQNSKNRIVLEYATDGKPLPPEHLATFFDVGGQQSLLRGGADYGLAPALARKIVHLFSGSVVIANGDAHGVRITVSFKPFGMGEGATHMQPAQRISLQQSEHS